MPHYGRFSITGDEFTAWRKAMDLTQEQIAAELGVTLSTVTRWEREGNQRIPSPLLGRAMNQLHLERKANQ